MMQVAPEKNGRNTVLTSVCLQVTSCRAWEVSTLRAAALLQMPKHHLCIRNWATKQVQSTANGDIKSALSSPVDQLKIILQRKPYGQF